MSTALRIGPSDDDKFLTVEALDLEPCAPVRALARTLYDKGGLERTDPHQQARGSKTDPKKC